MPPKNAKKDKPGMTVPKTRSFVLPLVPPDQATHDAITRAVKRRKRWASGIMAPMDEDQVEELTKKAMKEEEKRRREEERERVS